jgi:hypothetical protein
MSKSASVVRRINRRRQHDNIVAAYNIVHPPPPGRYLTSNETLDVPPGFHAIVLVKRDMTKPQEAYLYEALIRRSVAPVLYKHTSGDQVIRFDLPDGVSASEASVRSLVRDFLLANGAVESAWAEPAEGPPISHD